MRKLYLIRHGQCRDGAHRCIGGTDLPLDEVGPVSYTHLPLPGPKRVENPGNFSLPITERFF